MDTVQQTTTAAEHARAYAVQQTTDAVRTAEGTACSNEAYLIVLQLAALTHATLSLAAEVRALRLQQHEDGAK